MATGLATRGGLPVGADGSIGSGNTVQSRGGGHASLGQKAILGHSKSQRQTPAFTSFPRRQLGKQHTHTVSAALVEADPRTSLDKGQRPVINVVDAFAGASSGFPGAGSLPPALYKLLDPDAPVELPSPHKVNPRSLDNRELDKLVAALGRSKATWRRALVLHEWLLDMGHMPDDRLCTTLMRVCHQQGQAVTALSLYEWMRAQHQEGGAGLVPSVYTYTTAMRAALSGNLLEKALKVWDDAVANGCQPDCRMCTALIEVAARKGDTARALQMYEVMRHSSLSAPARDSRMAPSVHAYTAAMRAAAEGGLWQKALDIWSDMEAAGVTPTGHAFAAAISACAAGGCWQRAVQLFDRMLDLRIRPDVVSCTALITALGTDGQWERAERVVEWMARSGIKPNVRTYTALVTALGNAKQWDRAIGVVQRMKSHLLGGVEPNSYTYSALLKTMGEHGQWKLAEQVFRELEAETLRAQGSSAIPSSSSTDGRSPSSAASPAAAAAQLASQLQGMGLESDGVDADGQAYGQVALDAAERVLQSMDEWDDSGTAAPSSSGSSPQHHSTQHHHNAQHVAAAVAPQGNGFSYFSSGSAAAEMAVAAAAGGWPGAAPGMAQLNQEQAADVAGALNNANAARWGLERRGNEHHPRSSKQQLGGAAGGIGANRAGGASIARGRNGPVNEVVCGAMMLAYERAGRWDAAVDVLERAARMGIMANTIMYNTAMSALGKAGKWEAAEQVFRQMSSRDAVSFETLLAAYGMSGRAGQAEATFGLMLEAGHLPRDYAYCGLIAAHSLAGDWRSALAVPGRMRGAGVPATVHVYNALLAACERHEQWDVALELQQAMIADGIQPNAATYELLSAVGREGAAAVNNQQAAAAALSAVVAAAGTLLMRTGVF